MFQTEFDQTRNRCTQSLHAIATRNRRNPDTIWRQATTGSHQETHQRRSSVKVSSKFPTYSVASWFLWWSVEEVSGAPLCEEAVRLMGNQGGGKTLREKRQPACISGGS